jgi:hypothetical protein
MYFFAAALAVGSTQPSVQGILTVLCPGVKLPRMQLIPNLHLIEC